MHIIKFVQLVQSVRIEMNLEDLKSRFGFREPDRGLDKEGEDVLWRYGSKPDYTLANTSFLSGKTQDHQGGKNITSALIIFAFSFKLSNICFCC